MDNRVLEFQGIHNFRDYGGYAMRDGARVKSGLLYRSAQHLDATPDDLGRLSALKLSSVIDLRGDSERALYPCPRPAGFSAKVLFVPGETAGSHGLAPHEQLAHPDHTAESARDAMVRLYEAMPWRPVLVGTMKLYFGALLEEDGPSLLHCVAGKDRTGLVAALLHALLSVHEDDIMADYLLTNSAGNQERRIAAIRDRPGTPYAEMEETALLQLLMVDPEYLSKSLTAIDERHGSVAAYAEAVLGLDSLAVERLTQRFAA